MIRLCRYTGWSGPLQSAYARKHIFAWHGLFPTNTQHHYNATLTLERHQRDALTTLCLLGYSQYSPYLSNDDWKSWKACCIFWSAICNAPQITPNIVFGFSACTFSAINLSSQPVDILLFWNSSVSRSLIKYSTVVLKSPRIESSFKAITMFL